MHSLVSVVRALHVGLGDAEGNSLNGRAAGENSALSDLLISSHRSEFQSIVCSSVDGALLKAVLVASEVFKSTVGQLSELLSKSYHCFLVLLKFSHED